MQDLLLALVSENGISVPPDKTFHNNCCDKKDNVETFDAGCRRRLCRRLCRRRRCRNVVFTADPEASKAGAVVGVVAASPLVLRQVDLHDLVRVVAFNRLAAATEPSK